MHSETAEQLESIAVSLTQIVAKVDGRGKASDGNASMPMQYKVLTQKDKWFSGTFDPEKLEGAINSYAAQGWRVCGVATATFPGFGGSRAPKTRSGASTRPISRPLQPMIQRSLFGRSKKVAKPISGRPVL